MTATSKCFTPIRAQVLRATRLDACGVPAPGTRSTLVSDGIISVEAKANYDSGTKILVRNAAGKIKASDPAPQVLDYYAVTITCTDVEPDLYEMLTGQQLVTDSAGNSVGFRVNEEVSLANGIALETWTNIATDASACVGGVQNWGYFLLPYIASGTLGDISLNDGALSFVLNGNTKRGSGWDVGPYNVVEGAAAAPSPLATPIVVGDHMHVQLTTLAPPVAACGAIALAA